MTFNVYCDETCHLEHDGINVMVLGCVWCPKHKLKELNKEIRQIKINNDVSPTMELKWTKISPAKIDLYEDLMNFYFDNYEMYFRAVLIPDKSKLNHNQLCQSHDDWYYKMYFDLLKAVFDPNDSYEIYIDIKDTNSYLKAQELKEVCSNSLYDFSEKIIRRIQPIRSDEVEVMQIVDILIGAIGYNNRMFPDNFKKSEAKQRIVELIKKRSGYTMEKTTLLRESKLNLLVWEEKTRYDG